MNTEQIKNAVEKYHNYIVEMRREFHRYRRYLEKNSIPEKF